MKETKMQITSFTNNNYNTSNKTSNLEKTKNNDFESLISSTKSTNETTTQKTEEKDIIVDKSSTQSLYEDIISLLRTGFTVDELKAFEERLKQILKMKEDKDSGKEISIKDIEAALKQLEMEILEAKKNGGAGHARNLSLEKATGRYITFLDADDFWEPDFLQEMVSFMKQHDAELAYSSYARCDEHPTRRIVFFGGHALLLSRCRAAAKTP